MFKPGQSGNPEGRTPGIPNRLTREVKEILEQAFEGIGGVEAFVKWGSQKKNRGEFYKLWVKILPKDMKITGDFGLGQLFEMMADKAKQVGAPTNGNGHAQPSRLS